MYVAGHRITVYSASPSKVCREKDILFQHQHARKCYCIASPDADCTCMLLLCVSQFRNDNCCCLVLLHGYEGSSYLEQV